MSFRDGNFELYMINVDGSGLVRLTNSPTHDLVGRWSPDGMQVVFVNSVDVDTSSIFIVNSNGTGTRTLVNNGARNFVSEWRVIP